MECAFTTVCQSSDERVLRAEANDCAPHILQVLNAARKVGLRVFYALHRRYRPGDYETWRYVAPIQKAAWEHRTFEYGTWGGQIRLEFEPKPGEIVSGGALVFERLRQHRFGFAAQEAWNPSAHRDRAHSAYLRRSDCSLCRGACYEVTVVRDATADYSDEAMRAALDVNMPNYASAIVPTKEIVAAITSL